MALTKVDNLTPGAVIGAAKRDLQRIEINKIRRKQKEPPEHYAFLRQHVQQAKTAKDLIALALAHDLTPHTWKRQTLAIYSSRTVLQAAFDSS